VDTLKEFWTKERLMFERVLVAIDSSEHSEQVIQVASELAKRFESAVLVLNVREVLLATRSNPIGKATPEQSQTLVQQAAERLVKDGVNAHGESAKAVQSGAAKEILDAAKKFKANLIIMGTHGRSEIAGLLLGSVASKVLRHAECPVTLVR
jgi:nucleotide-binding universal stress UspA family protein